MMAAASASFGHSTAFLDPPGQAGEILSLAIACNSAKLDHEGSLAVHPAVTAVSMLRSAADHIQVRGQSHGLAVCMSSHHVSCDCPCSTAVTVPKQAQTQQSLQYNLQAHLPVRMCGLDALAAHVTTKEPLQRGNGHQWSHSGCHVTDET